MKWNLCVLAVAATLSSAAMAAEPAAKPKGPDAASVDAVVRKLESSGALDAAVDRALARYAQRQQQAAQQEEARRQAQLQAQAKNARAVDGKQDHVRGKTSADVTLIEYTDFECPFCKQFHGTPSALLDRYQGRVNWVIRSFPLPFHDPAARKEALVGECVAQLGGNDAFWTYADAVFANTKSNGGGLPEDKSVEKLAEAGGVSGAALIQCMTDDAVIQRVDQDIADGNAAGISATPTTIVRNNRTGASEAIAGALPSERMEAAVERMLNAKP